MEKIDLNNIPQQECSFDLDTTNGYIKISLYLRYYKIMYMDIYINDKLILKDIPCMPNKKLIPPTYKYIINQLKGNFIFQTTEDNEYPIYTNFNTTNFLYFIPENELS